MATSGSALEDMDARLAAVLAAASDAILSYAADGTILTWNPAAERMLGYTPEEVIGQPVSVIVPPEHADEVADLFSRMSTGEPIRDVDMIRVRKDGVRIPVRVNMTPIVGQDGAVSGVSATLSELGERHRAEARFRGLLESAPDPIIGVGGDGRIVFANAETENVFGYGRAELVGQPVELLLPQRFRDRHQHERAEYERAPSTRPMGVGLDLWARRRDGTEIPVEISLSPMADTDGSLTIAIVRDVTEQRRAREALRERERTFRAIFNSTFQFIALMSPHGRLLEVNQSLLDLAGIRAEEVIGKPLWETPWWAHSPELRARLREAVAAAAQGHFVRFEASHPRADGSLAAVDFSLKPIRDEAGEVTLIVKEGRDVTDRTRAELERERLLAVAEEARAKAEASLRARAEAEHLKDDLTNMVVHDLKNPVSGITMLIQAALRRRDGLPPRQRETLLQIDRTCREMLRLVQNLLEIAKMEEGKIPVAREPVAIADVVDEVVREYVSVAEETGKELSVAISPKLPAVAADPALLKRVLVNLVVNGLRHSGSREVRLESTPAPDDGQIAIRVIDHGRGIPEDEQARIFEKFASVRRGTEGEASADTGLGLPFCRLAVERMGGRIRLTSAPGAPTIFAVTLPIHAPAR